ncbi:MULTISPECIES: 2-succinyl-6-hydroxy-2,4-cyclohexadiene-1-carboxylate synthase [Sporosarcina]|uniref:Putative 2-succinyl-6-hydroxy-2,4-cyclohexadiene-1-carboxylate synthase n=1 Tax=Sporosarcina contaminans TaxID=633403 RepID=A0ABW3TWU8_9BACL
MNEISLKVRGVDYYVEISGKEDQPSIVFLHGFTGSTATWNEVRSKIAHQYRTIAIDLIGHGKTSVPDDPSRYTMEQIVEDLHCIFKQIDLDKFSLIGYSMGGRVALSYAIAHSESLNSLLLESASPGLKSEEQRAERRKADAKLSEKIIKEGIHSFVDLWENIPLFHSQKRLSSETKKQIRNERLQQREKGLANSLLGYGTGSQQSNWQYLHTLHLPVLLITGQLDEKFVTIAREMKKEAPLFQHTIVEDAGHAIHVEKPKQFVTIVEEFLNDLKI